MTDMYMVYYGTRGQHDSVMMDEQVYDTLDEAVQAIEADGYERFRIGGESEPIFVRRGAGFPQRGHEIAWVKTVKHSG